MAYMTRDRATERLNRCREILEITSHMDNQNRKAFDMAISDMKRVEELENEVASVVSFISALNESLEHCHEKKLEYYSKCKELEKENKRLTDGIAKVKVEIERQEKWLLQASYNSYNIDIAFGSINSVLAESEG